MPAAKTWTFKNEVFITSRATCLGCGHKFKFSLTFPQLMTWERLCAICSPNILELPDKGMIITEPLDVTEWL